MEPYSTQDAMVAFFYELLRDHVPIGIVQKIVDYQDCPTSTEWVLTNNNLAKCALELVDQLQAQTQRAFILKGLQILENKNTEQQIMETK